MNRICSAACVLYGERPQGSPRSGSFLASGWHLELFAWLMFGEDAGRMDWQAAGSNKQDSW
jgi:hypothetical protein